MGWEQAAFSGSFNAWLQALGSDGDTVDVTHQAPEYTGEQLLERYDAVVMTTRSASAGVLTPQFQAALELFLRQGGGLILVQTADQQQWMDQPVNLLLPTTFFRPGPGWGTGLAAHNVRLLPVAADPLTAGIDWTAAPPVHTIRPTPAPDNEIYRGALQLLGPREELRKPLLNGEWKELLTADDPERTPVAVTGSYGRGHILVWGAGFGGDPDHAEIPAPFTAWQGFAPLWRRILDRVVGSKLKPESPGVWIVGTDRDNLRGKAWNGQDWAFPAAVSYALREFGLTGALAPDGARAALVLKADPAQDAALGKLLAEGASEMLCDPAAADGALKTSSPFLPGEAAAPTMPAIVLGTPAPKLPAPPAQPPSPAPQPIVDPALQPPAAWKVRTTNSITFQRDLAQQWQAPGYDDSAWDTRPLGPLSQTIGGKAVPLAGAAWYRAHIHLPPAVPARAAWTFAVHPGLFRPQFRAWVDGKEVALDGWSLPLAAVAPGDHLLALRLYDAGGSSYWQGSRELYHNVGITGAVTELLPQTHPVQDWAARWGYHSPADVTRGASSKLPADAPVLFHGRSDGDRDFRLSVTLTDEQAHHSPLLIFDEPGLIRQVTVNGVRVERIGQGAWDGVSGGNCSAFLLRDCLRAGENVIEFHPDFLRLRDEDYPVAADVAAPCGLPRLEFTGDLQALVAVDPQLAPYVPDRLFRPGTVRAVSPQAHVLLRWNDGRPALVEQGKLLAWTSDITAQLNAAPVHQWQVTWESSGHWDLDAEGIPRGDSLLWENAAPLLSAVLADRLTPGRPRIASVQRHGTDRAVDVVVDNPGPAQAGILLARIQDWQGGITTDTRLPVTLGAGRTTITVPASAAPVAGQDVRDSYAFYLGLRSGDLTTGWDYTEKVIDLPPPVRITVETDSLNERVLHGSIPDRLASDPAFRGRHLWWPLLHEDPGSTVYLDGETLHAHVTLTNETDAPQTVTVDIALHALGRNVVEYREMQSVSLPPRGRKTLDLAKPLTGAFEPYLLQVTTEGKGLPRVEVDRPLYAVRPWKQCVNIDDAPRADGISFNCYIPFTYLPLPDEVTPTRPLGINADPHRDGPFPELLEWWISTGTGTKGHGGGVSGYTGLTQGFGWGPFYRPTFMAPDEMSVLPNGEPVLHYLADGLRREVKAPGRYEVADFWGNYWVPVNWNTLAAFREWLAANEPQSAASFHPQTYDEAVAMIREKYGPEWNRWQAAVAIGGWDAIRKAAAPGSSFWCQAENAWIATEGVRRAPLDQNVDGRPVARFLSDLYVAGDTDPATSRVGWGYRFRSYTENTAVALVPNMHCNVTTLRHMYFVNEQRMSNMGNATPETYRAHAYDTLWAAAVEPDGSLRAVVDTPPSEITIYPNPTWSGLKYGNRLYDHVYRLASVIEPQKVLGLLWVAAVPGEKPGVDPRAVYETLRNAGVPLSGMISPEYLDAAPRTGASGLVYLLPSAPGKEDLERLRKLVDAGFPVVCLVPPAAEGVKAQIPAGAHILELPQEFSPDAARQLASAINQAAHAPLHGPEGVCLYGFRAQGRSFLVVQNMQPVRRHVSVRIDRKSSASTGPTNTVDLNTNTPIPAATAPDHLTLNVPLGPWDAALVAVGD